MSKILLSIKPEYAHSILEGNKKFEYRKRLPKRVIKKIVIYSTYPEKRIIGEVDVIETLELNPKELWRKTENYAGISKTKYFEYFGEKNIGYAYTLGEVKKFEKPKLLCDYGLKTAPQSFVYLK